MLAAAVGLLCIVFSDRLASGTLRSYELFGLPARGVSAGTLRWMWVVGGGLLVAVGAADQGWLR